MISFFIKAVSYVMALLVSVIGAGIYELKFTIYTQPFSEVYEGDFYSTVPYDKYLLYDEPVQGVIYDVRDYGAVPDDETVLNNNAINAAIKACSQNGGGTVLVDGGNYRTGSIAMLSDVTLKIAKDSTLTASHNSADMNLGCLLYANGCDNITITGPGKICGEGNYYARKPAIKPVLTPPEFTDTFVMSSSYNSQIRFGCPDRYGVMTSIDNSTDVTVSNIVFENSAAWTLKMENCGGVMVNRLIINNNRNIANADGIDVVYSNNVEIGNTFVSTQDDGIVLKNWSVDGILEDVYIHDCEVMSRTNAFKIGTETRGIIRNILVENCYFFMRDIYPGTGSGIAIESVDGTKLTNVTVRNITMDRVVCPLFIRLGNRNRYADDSSDFSGTIQGVTVENITATNTERAAMITGIYNSEKGTNYVKNVTLKNFNLTYTTASKEALLFLPVTPEFEKEYPESRRFLNLPAYGVWARHVDGLTIENFNVTPPDHTNRLKFVFCDVLNLSKDS